MDRLEKLPRWALVLIATVGIGAIGYIGVDAKGKVEAAVANSAEATQLSNQNQKDIGELKQSVADIRVSQETFRKEYREDQKDLDKKLDALLVAVKS